METEKKEPVRLRIDKSLELLEWLIRHQMSLREAASVLGYIETGKTFAEALLTVFVLIDERKEQNAIPNHVFHDPVVC